MKVLRFSILLLVLAFVPGVQAQDFIIGAFLDPYSAHGTGVTPYIQEYFDSIKAFGLNRVMGIGNATTTGQGIANSFGQFKVIPSNSIGGGVNEVVVTSQEPKTLERFTTFGWHMTLEVEVPINDDNLKDFAYGFHQQTGSIDGGTLIAKRDTNSVGWLFTGPGETFTRGSGLMWSPRFVVPGTWGQADYILKLGDTTGVADTATVARLERLDAARAVRETVELLKSNPAYRFFEIELKLLAPNVWVQADEGQLKQIIINLAANGLEAMEKTLSEFASGTPLGKKLLIACGYKSRRPEEDPLPFVSVSDEGKGIPRNLLSKIFHPFFSTKKSGTGLGLPIVLRLVTNLGGSLDFTSEPGRGTTFLFFLQRPELKKESSLPQLVKSFQ